MASKIMATLGLRKLSGQVHYIEGKNLTPPMSSIDQTPVDFEGKWPSNLFSLFFLLLESR
jgi:hypothetical protein